MGSCVLGLHDPREALVSWEVDMASLVRAARARTTAQHCPRDVL